MVLSPENLKGLMRRLGHHFQDNPLFQQALTHRSAHKKNNERLEFLGDAVLNAIVAAHLFQHRPHASEGELTRMRAKWVCEATLAQIAHRFELHQFLILGPGEKKGGGAQRASILADALEALIGALYLDAGMEVCRSVVLSWYAQEDKTLWEGAQKDPKTQLQERLQAKQWPLPVYSVLETIGDPHHPLFRVRCEVTSLDLMAIGEADSRKHAEQAAAEALLQQLEGDPRV